MATYASLTDQEKTNLATYDKFLRGVLSSLMTLHKNSDPIIWSQFAIDNIDTVLASLDAGEVIPNSTSLGAAVDLNIEEFQTLQAIIRGLATTAETNIATLVKAVGVNA